MNALRMAGQTDVGRRRTDNQDTFLATPLWSDEQALLAVIDGVGGYAGGAEAAALAQESITQYMNRPTGKPLTMLREAVVFANNRINEQRQQEPRLSQMCCVLTTAVADVTAGKLHFVHVGDTRLYRYRQGQLEKLTHDHSLVGVREDAHELTEAEAMQHPRRNEILREVGSTDHRVDDEDFLEWGETDFRPGDYLLLCSDGLTDMITRAQMQAVLDQPVPPDEQVAELIRLANEAGGNDNVTVVLAQYNAPASDPPSPMSAARTGTDTPPVFTSVPATAAVTPPVQSQRPTDIPVKRTTNAGLWLTMGLLLAALIGGVVWYQSQTYESTDFTSDADSLRVAVSGPDSVAVPARSALDSLVQVAHRSPDHRLLLSTDTLRLSRPLLMTDSLMAVLGGTPLGGTPQTVVVPLDTNRAAVAIRITRPGATTLGNLVISGFRTGVETPAGASLRLTNVYFRGVDVPISAVVRQDTFRNGVVGVSVQNQAVQPKPSRP